MPSVARKPAPPVDALLCSALALACDADHAPYEPFTLVNQTVEAAKASSGEIDTVVVAVTDHIGRLIGKRFDVDFFFERNFMFNVFKQYFSHCRSKHDSSSSQAV